MNPSDFSGPILEDWRLTPPKLGRCCGYQKPYCEAAAISAWI